MLLSHTATRLPAHRAVAAALLFAPPPGRHNPWRTPGRACLLAAPLCAARANKYFSSSSSRASNNSSSYSSSRYGKANDAGGSNRSGSNRPSRRPPSSDTTDRQQQPRKPDGKPSRAAAAGGAAQRSSPPPGAGRSGGNNATNNTKPSQNNSSSSNRQRSEAPAFIPISSPLPEHAPLVVVGAGAAGLTAAYFAAKQGAQVVVLERTREAGKKVLMSGGTRCNVLPLEADLPIDYVTSSSRSALRAVFASWSLAECHAWLQQDIRLQLLLEEETRKWFPASNSGREVRDRLVAACQDLGVRFVYNASVESLTPPATAPHHQQQQAATTNTNSSGQHKQQQRTASDKGAAAAAAAAASCWRLGLASGLEMSADRLILSTGGYSFPAVGTDGTGLRLLTGLGHRLSEGGCYAALTPLKGPHPGGEQLAGLTLADVRLSVLKGGSNKVLAAAQRGGLLFTHKGYSGPAILDVSHWLVKELEQQQRTQQQQQQQPPRLVVDWTGDGLQAWQERFAAASGATTVNQLLRKHGIKERLANALALEVGVTGRPLSQLKKSEKEQLLTALTAWQLPVQGHEGYPKAEVTGGGVPLEQVDCKTMESRVLPGLFLCGEVLDVFGRIGGFNFWWAWLSGRLAGQGAAAAVALAATGTTEQAGKLERVNCSHGFSVWSG